MEYSFIIPTIVVVVTGVLGWLLARKDEQQQKDITNLYQLHKEDSMKLEALQRELDREHYRKNELDSKFDRLDDSIQAGFQGIRNDVKEMLQTLHNHITAEHTKGQ